jgi:hypothetical protein
MMSLPSAQLRSSLQYIVQMKLKVQYHLQLCTIFNHEERPLIDSEDHLIVSSSHDDAADRALLIRLKRSCHHCAGCLRFLLVLILLLLVANP